MHNWAIVMIESNVFKRFLNTVAAHLDLEWETFDRRCGGRHTYFSLPRRLGWDFWASCLALRCVCLVLVFSSCFLMEDFMERSWKSCCCWPVCCLSANRCCSWNDGGRWTLYNIHNLKDAFSNCLHIYFLSNHPELVSNGKILIRSKNPSFVFPTWNVCNDLFKWIMQMYVLWVFQPSLSSFASRSFSPTA